MFHLVNVRFQGFQGVIFGHAHRLLRHNGPLVVVLVGEMHGDARNLHTGREGVGDSVRALERGQQRRMQVQHAVRERVEHDGRDHAHVAGHDDVFSAGVLECGDDFRVRRGRVGILVAVHHQHRDVRRLRALNAVRVGARGNHLHDLDGQALPRRIDNGLEIRAAAGQQHPHLEFVSHSNPFVVSEYARMRYRNLAASR